MRTSVDGELPAILSYMCNCVTATEIEEEDDPMDLERVGHTWASHKLIVGCTSAGRCQSTRLDAGPPPYWKYLEVLVQGTPVAKNSFTGGARPRVYVAQ